MIFELWYCRSSMPLLLPDHDFKRHGCHVVNMEGDAINVGRTN
jgi:hypothetical protein